MSVRAIREQYHGVWFRSKLEAKWARLFDDYAIRWEYEPQGFALSQNSAYLPDFWLPAINTVVEVKGLLDPASEEKIKLFAEACVHDLWPEVRTHGDEDPQPQFDAFLAKPLFLLAGDPQWGMQIISADGITPNHPEDGIELAHCRECQHWWFNPVAYWWVCRHCGASDGDHHIDETIPAGRWVEASG